MIFYTSLIVLRVRGKEQLVDLWGPIDISYDSVGGIVGIAEAESMSEDILVGSSLIEVYLSLCLMPSFKSISIISPSPWSSTFSMNLELLLKKSPKLRDLITTDSSYPASSVYLRTYRALLQVVPISYRLFSCVYAILAGVDRYLSTILPFPLQVGYPVISSTRHTGFPCRRFR